ncbi:MAG: maleylpyruvate isomerase family mycothiol-dependent enzyme [Acidimicrobiia bacterium]|nr:maleylpyruvate isomerase family mycothiol-dependent enzyme [Acidimicrobiia bacterium]
MIDYLSTLQRESNRIAVLTREADRNAPVPTCPEWTVADLIWHVTEVQYFWATVVESLLQDPETIPQLVRPEDRDLSELFAQQSVRLHDALERRNAEDSCWSWHDDGRSVGWVRRRQAHEALIHRVDAEIATNSRTPVERDLGADGVDEILRVNIDLGKLPEWAAFHKDGTSARVETSDGLAAWSMNFGRFVGSSPVSGNDYDFVAAELTSTISEPTVIIRGTPEDLDLWLWGRGSLDLLSISGDPRIAEKLREAAAEATQ